MMCGYDNIIGPAFFNCVFNKTPAISMLLIETLPSQHIFTVLYIMEVTHISLGDISVLR